MYQVPTTSLNLLTWNASGFMSSSAYIERVLNKLNIAVCGISEHWLYQKDLFFLQSINCKYRFIATSDMDLEISSRRKVGKGRVTLFWKYDIDNYSAEYR